MKTIVVACATGVATSSVINSALQRLLKQHKIHYKTIQCPIAEVDAYAEYADLIVSAVKPDHDLGTPTLMGMGFITGRNVEELEQQVLQLMKG